MISARTISAEFTVRPGGPADAPLIARHRAAMFADMGRLPADLHDELVAVSIPYLETALADGSYLAWLAAPAADPTRVVAGAGVLVRRVPPHPAFEGDRIVAGRQAIVLNVYTEPDWRRRGLARHLMEQVLEWARGTVDTLVLHASDEGRPLYEQMGFVATSEMRYTGPLLSEPER